MILKLLSTGRKYGDTSDPVISYMQIAGVKCVITESDFWEGPVDASQQGQYFRGTFLTTKNEPRDDRFRQASS